MEDLCGVTAQVPLRSEWCRAAATGCDAHVRPANRHSAKQLKLCYVLAMGSSQWKIREENENTDFPVFVTRTVDSMESRRFVHNNKKEKEKKINKNRGESQFSL